MVRPIKAELDETVRLEIEMHKKTMHLPAVRDKIEQILSPVAR